MKHMHVKEHSNARRAFLALLAKDARMSSGLLTMAAALLGISYLVVLFVTPFWAGSFPRQSTDDIGGMFLPIALMLTFLPILLTSKLVYGDADHRAGLLSASLPVSTAMKYWSKLTIVSGAILTLSFLIWLTIAAGKQHESTLEGYLEAATENAWRAGIFLAIGMMGAIWGFGASALTRSAGNGTGLAWLMPPILTSLTLGMGWLALFPLRSLYARAVGFDARFASIGPDLTGPLGVRAVEISLVVAAALGVLCA